MQLFYVITLQQLVLVLQPSRLDSCNIAVQKAKKFQFSKIKNSIAASDAFFPFADGINTLVKAGVKTIIQPGGSIRDQEIINAANKAKLKCFLRELDILITNQFYLFLQLK